MATPGRSLKAKLSRLFSPHPPPLLPTLASLALKLRLEAEGLRQGVAREDRRRRLQLEEMEENRRLLVELASQGEQEEGRWRVVRAEVAIAEHRERRRGEREEVLGLASRMEEQAQALQDMAAATT